MKQSQNQSVNDLVSQYQPLVKRLVRTFNPRDSEEFNEMLQVSNLRLLKAAHKNFNPARGSFATFVHQCVKSILINYINKRGTEHSRFTTLYQDIECYTLSGIIDILPDTLSIVELEIITLLMQRYTQVEIMAIQQCSRTELRAYIRQIRGKLEDANA